MPSTEAGVRPLRNLLGIFYFVLCFNLLRAVQRQSGSYLCATYMRRWVLDANHCWCMLFKGAYCMFAVVVQARCGVVLLFLFEDFGTVQCLTLSSSSWG